MHVVQKKESYENTQDPLEHIRYNDYTIGLQLDYTRNSCLIHEWDSHARDRHYIQKKWLKREALTLGIKKLPTNH